MDEEVAQIRAERAELSRAHAELRRSPRFTNAEKFLWRLFHAYGKTLNAAVFASTRDPNLAENSMYLRSADRFLESAVSIFFGCRDGLQHPARRELRHVLEASVKYLWVDQKHPESPIEDKIAKYAKVDREKIDLVDDLSLFLLSADDATTFRNAVKSEYSRLCAFVHPAAKTFATQIKNDDDGFTIGRESVDQFEEILEEVKRVLDFSLSLLFHALGPSFAGDLFIHVLDEDDGWKFRKAKFCSKVSSHFDYKAERISARRITIP